MESDFYPRKGRRPPTESSGLLSKIYLLRVRTVGSKGGPWSCCPSPTTALTSYVKCWGRRGGLKGDDGKGFEGQVFNDKFKDFNDQVNSRVYSGTPVDEFEYHRKKVWNFSLRSLPRTYIHTHVCTHSRPCTLRPVSRRYDLRRKQRLEGWTGDRCMSPWVPPDDYERLVKDVTQYGTLYFSRGKKGRGLKSPSFVSGLEDLYRGLRVVFDSSLR